VQAALSILSDEHREIVVLRDMEGFTYDEISEFLDISLGTVRSRLHRARQQFREHYEHLEKESEKSPERPSARVTSEAGALRERVNGKRSPHVAASNIYAIDRRQAIEPPNSSPKSAESIARYVSQRVDRITHNRQIETDVRRTLVDFQSEVTDIYDLWRDGQVSLAEARRRRNARLQEIREDVRTMRGDRYLMQENEQAFVEATANNDGEKIYWE